MIIKFFFKILFLLFINQSVADVYAEYILISKSNRLISMFLSNGNVRNFSISLGFEPYDTKVKKGDGKTPEGLYYIENKIHDSAFFLALQISYPNPWDIRRAVNLNTHPGGQIMIHGVPNLGFDKNFHNKDNDWTEGCVAVNNQEMKFIWKHVEVGTPILIRK